jgi:excisionase family DNA binding protein
MNLREQLLTVKEAAARTGHKEATWRAWILLRKVPYHKVGRSIRIAESDLTRLIEESRVPARASR